MINKVRYADGWSTVVPKKSRKRMQILSWVKLVSPYSPPHDVVLLEPELTISIQNSIIIIVIIPWVLDQKIISTLSSHHTMPLKEMNKVENKHKN